MHLLYHLCERKALERDLCQKDCSRRLLAERFVGKKRKPYKIMFFFAGLNEIIVRYVC